MPTYALLGATGGTGSAVLHSLLSQPPQDLTLRILIRSEKKLLSLFPNLLTQDSIKITLSTDPITSTSALAKFLHDVDLIYNCIATNESTPGVTIARSTATALLSALQNLRDGQAKSYKPPTILINRSQTLNPSLPFAGFFGGLTKWMVHFTLYNVYHDIELACEMYAAAPPDLLKFVFVDPPALHDTEGREGTGFELVRERCLRAAGLNYADLGEAFVVVGERRAEFEGKGVGVSATGFVREEWGVLVGYMLRGLRGRVLGW